MRHQTLHAQWKFIPARSLDKYAGFSQANRDTLQPSSLGPRNYIEKAYVLPYIQLVTLTGDHWLTSRFDNFNLLYMEMRLLLVGFISAYIGDMSGNKKRNVASTIIGKLSSIITPRLARTGLSND